MQDIASIAKLCKDAVGPNLKRLFQLRGIPQKKLMSVWGISEGRISEKLNHSTLDLEQLLDALEILAIKPSEFFAALETGFDPELVLADFIAEKPRQFRRFVRDHLAKPPQQHNEPTELAAMADGLESLRFVDADEAFRRAVEILRCLGPAAIHPRFRLKASRDVDELDAAMADVAAEAWGVLGVVQRLRGRTATTAASYLSALHLGRSPAVRARTFQRIGMLLNHNSDDQAAAVHAVLIARRIYLDAADDSGVGKTFVDEGAIVGSCGDYQSARDLHRQALRYLDDNDVEHRFAAVQGMSIASVFLDEIEDAATSIDKAAASLPAHQPILTFSLHWLRGELAFALDQAHEALEHLSRALDAADEAGAAPLELVLIKLRIAKAHHLTGDPSALRLSIYDLMSIHRDLRLSKALSAILGEFLAIALEGRAEQVTAELLEQVYRKIREGTTSTFVPPPLLNY